MNMEINPCPFCGGEAKAWCDGAWYVECLSSLCRARTRHFIDLESATEAWNTRAERTHHAIKEWSMDDVRDLIERYSDEMGSNGRRFHNGAYARIAEELNGAKVVKQ